MKYVAPWRAPGSDMIPAALYKYLPAAAAYLEDFVYRALTGKYHLTREDVEGNLILIHKSGDRTDPANYRPIALLNSDYKILTKVLHRLIETALPDGLIPVEQMARRGVWGTMHGLLLDKSYLATARLNRCEHHTAWYDFRKAFDSVSHMKLRQLVRILPIPEPTKCMFNNAMGQWNLNIANPRGRTNVRVQRGVYQGDSLSPFLFVLVTAGIVIGMTPC